MSSRTARYAKRSLHYIAYGSLAVDVTVALLTLGMITHMIADPGLLFVANIILAITVGVTIGLCLFIVALKWHIPVRRKLNNITDRMSVVSAVVRRNVWRAKTRYSRWALTRKKFFKI
jgi:hypothetical protein